MKWVASATIEYAFVATFHISLNSFLVDMLTHNSRIGERFWRIYYSVIRLCGNVQNIIGCQILQFLPVIFSHFPSHCIPWLIPMYCSYLVRNSVPSGDDRRDMILYPKLVSDCLQLSAFMRYCIVVDEAKM